MAFSESTIYTPTAVSELKALMPVEELIDKEIKDITNRISNGEEVDFDEERKRISKFSKMGGIADDTNWGEVSTAGELFAALKEIRGIDDKYYQFKEKYANFKEKSNNNKPSLY